MALGSTHKSSSLCTNAKQSTLECIIYHTTLKIDKGEKCIQFVLDRFPSLKEWCLKNNESSNIYWLLSEVLGLI